MRDDPRYCGRCHYAARRARILYYLPMWAWFVRYVVHTHWTRGHLVMTAAINPSTGQK